MNPEQQRKLILTRLADGPATPAELKRELGGISPATLSRLITSLGGRVISLGKARAIRYARPLDIRGMGDRFPVYRIDTNGDARLFGWLQALWGGRFWWDSAAVMPSTLFRHLPWFIQDMRPEGFTGRAFVQRISSELGLPARLSDWNDDALLVALSRRGEDCMGDLLLGDESLERYLRRSRQPLKPVIYPGEYCELAQQAMAGEPAGSSAGGEQPKFTTLLERDGKGLQVLVKFSPKMSSAEGERWADLLVCEHLALETVREAGFRAVASVLHRLGGRTFLEVERFDRCGETGRRPMHSLGVIDDEFFGRRDSWFAMADRLQATGRLSADDAAALRWLSVFGSLIANTDQHFGNITLIPQDESRVKFILAPAYDMLPMLYRPSGGEAAFPEFSPPLPLAGTVAHYDHAHRYALLFWEKAAVDNRISAAFRTVCEKNHELLKRSREGRRVLQSGSAS